jgi:hypothetical protein
MGHACCRVARRVKFAPHHAARRVRANDAQGNVVLASINQFRALVTNGVS